MIIGVCVKFGDFIEVRMPKPNRHCHCFWHFIECYGADGTPKGLSSAGKQQGFYTHTGRFLDREQAAKYVKRIKQPTVEPVGKYLFSETVW